MKTIRRLAAGTAALMAATSAQAAVIDFNELSHGGYYQPVNPLISGGFSFVNNGAGFANSALGVWGSNGSETMDPGAAAVFHNYSNSITTVTKVGGGIFDLNSIDLADVYNNGFGGDVLLTFTDGMGTTSQNVTLDNLVGGQTFALNRNGLTAFTMQGVTTQGGWLQFDNVVVNGQGAVPEPSAWALMILGFGVVGPGMRRRSVGTRFAAA